MVDWEKIINSQDEDELRELKLWLFRENIRISNELKNLEQARDKFIEERTQFRDEMNALNKRSITERKRLKEETMFFDKKMLILQAGFQQLEADRKAFELQKKRFMEEQKLLGTKNSGDSEDLVGLLFRNVNNPLALRKRYRDLVKIFHPDNQYGDDEIAQMINKEFLRRRKEDWK